MTQRPAGDRNRVPREGGCFCGAVRYQVDGEPAMVTHCHCRNCRRSTGAPFVTWAEFRADRFRLLTGRPATLAASNGVVRAFCARCGSHLTYRRTDTPGALDVTVGTLDDPEALRPADHTWTSRKLSWIHLGDGLPSYPQAARRKRDGD